jgi:hypothetical protein
VENLTRIRRPSMSLSKVWRQIKCGIILGD